jgi:hypothetical protein
MINPLLVLVDPPEENTSVLDCISLAALVAIPKAFAGEELAHTEAELRCPLPVSDSCSSEGRDPENFLTNRPAPAGSQDQ